MKVALPMRAVLLALALVLTLTGRAAHGVEPAAADPFRGLEDASDIRTQDYFRAEAARTRAALEKIPGREEMLARIRRLSESQTTVSALALTATRVFYLRLAPGNLSPVLCVRDGLAAPERVLIDPQGYSRDSHAAAIDWFRPSPDGRLVAFGVAVGGEDAILRVASVDEARVLPFEIDRARFNEALAWHPDSRSFYYARVPEGQPALHRYANVRMYRHVLGRDTARDEVVFAPGVGGALDIPEVVYPAIYVPLESRHAYAIARDGVRREIALHVTDLKDLAAGRPRWRKIAGYDDEVLSIEGWRDDLYLLSKRNAPRHRVLRVKGGAPDLKVSRLVVPEGESVIEAMGLARDALYLKTMVGGVDRLERVSMGLLGGARAPEFVRTPFDSNITQLVTHPRDEGAILVMQGWIDPPAVLRVDRRGELHRAGLQPPSTVDFSAMDEVRLYATSHDGVKIPVTLLYKKTTRLTGDNPTLLVGYGSHGRSLTPTFDAARLAWLERGGVFALAHVRGGGEYGETWHAAGRHALKINTILDFISVSEFVSSYGFTSPRRLAVMGTGLGAIAAGGAFARRPELYAAMIGRAPMMDMVRYELTRDGPANVPEFGSASTAEGLAALRVISAYHQVRDTAAYPGVLLTVGTGNARIEPWQPAKMAARLQAASSNGRPVLLRGDPESAYGHGSARAQREEELADIYSFALWQMGEAQFQPPPPPPELMGPPAPNP